MKPKNQITYFVRDKLKFITNDLFTFEEFISRDLQNHIKTRLTNKLRTTMSTRIGNKVMDEIQREA